MAAGALPIASACWWRQDASSFARSFVPLCLGVGAIAFLAIWPVVPQEALDDIVGSPTLGLNGTVERGLRFIGLVIGPFAGLTLGARLAIGPVRGGQAWTGVAVTLALLALSYSVVVLFANTSNVVELLRGRGSVADAISVIVLLVWLGAVTALAGYGIVASRIRSITISFAMIVLSVPWAWQMFVLAGNPRLEKYGAVFSARQFLLSPDREHYLDDRLIFGRFAIAYVALLLLLSAGATIGLRTGAPTRGGASSLRDRSSPVVR